MPSVHRLKAVADRVPAIRPTRRSYTAWETALNEYGGTPMLLGPMLAESRRRTPDKVALWFGEQSWTYAALDDDSDRLAAVLFLL